MFTIGPCYSEELRSTVLLLSLIYSSLLGWIWWGMPIILALRMLRQEDREFRPTPATWQESSQNKQTNKFIFVLSSLLVIPFSQYILDSSHMPGTLVRYLR
jgi:hypothetical protein